MRERGTAALGLWQRAIGEDGPDREKTETELRGLITEFRDPGTRPDARAGLRWLAATLEHVIDNRVAVCNDWPDVGEPWFGHVQEAADDLDNSGIPAHLLTGTKNLFRHMILQNAGVYRRQAIETVVTSGWTEPVARALGSLLKTETGRGVASHPRRVRSWLPAETRLWVEADLTERLRACIPEPGAGRGSGGRGAAEITRHRNARLAVRGRRLLRRRRRRRRAREARGNGCGPSLTDLAEHGR